MRVRIAVAAALTATCGYALASPPDDVRLLSATPEGIVVEVPIPAATVANDPAHPGYQTITLGELPAQGDPGDPQLPRLSFWVALPPGARPEVAAEAGEVDRWDGIRPVPVPRGEWVDSGADEPPAYRESFHEGAGYAVGPTDWAVAGPLSSIRYVDAVPIIVTPARWDPRTGQLSVAHWLTIRIDFSQGTLKDSRRPISRDDPSWERTYESLFVNPAQARSWMRAPVSSSMSRGKAVEGDAAKIEVRTSGLRRVAFEDLDGVGWGGSGSSIEDLRLFERFYDSNDAAEPLETLVDVPILVDDADRSETWSTGDSFFFYAQNAFDRLRDQPWYLRRYGRLHVYWIGLRSGAANARMESDPSWLNRQDLTPLDSYPWTAHFEEEHEIYMKMGAAADAEFAIRDGVASVRTKHVYWNGGDPAYTNNNGSCGNCYSIPFDLPGFISPLGLAAGFQGLRTEGGRHRVNLFLTLGDIADTLRLPGTPYQFDNQDSGLYVVGAAGLAGMPLAEQGNRLIHTYAVNASGAALNWLDVSYLRQPKFVDALAEIATGDLFGPTEFSLARTPADSIIAVDYTDPRSPRYLAIDPANQIVGSGPGRRLRLQWDLTGGDRRIWLGGYESIPGPEGFAAASGIDLLSQDPADYIVIIPRAWIPHIQPLVEQRTGQGHKVLVAAIEDVYDQFSGGRHWSHAIRSFLRAMFRQQDPAPAFLLLVGDATDVFDTALKWEADGAPISDVNWVPTQTVFSESYTGQGPELVSSDQWFVDNLDGTGEGLTFLPDMHIGRLPVGSPEELDIIVGKIIAYEQFKPEDSWRNRALLVSDDIWSSSISFSEVYTHHEGSESIFEEAARRSIRVIQNDGPRCGFVADTFFIGGMMDPVESLGRCASIQEGRCLAYNPSADWIANFTYGGSTIRDRLVSEMGRGHLFVSYVGHANARLMTHEYIFRHNPISGRADIALLGNVGRPFIFMGYGCHLAEFSGGDEALPNRRDGIAENLMFYDYEGNDNRGGIAALASTGYEWIYTSDRYDLAVVRSFFKNPPQYEVEGSRHTRWVLGEIISRSKFDIVGQGPNSNTYLSMSETYNMLGDPGLRMDAAPPRVSVQADGVSLPSGTALTLAADADSIEFGIDVCDEVWARSLTIQDAGGVAQPDTVIVEPGEDRRFRALYRTTIMPRDYDFVLTAEDASGRASIATFPVRVDVVFEVKKSLQSWVALNEGERVLEEDSVRVRLNLPRYLTADDLEFLIEGNRAPFRATASNPVGLTARQWTLTLDETVPLGRTVTIAARVIQPDGVDFRRERTIATQAVFDILELYNVPNPFSESTWIFYLLGAPADNVEIKIYTSSGKLIRTLRNLPSRQLSSDPPIEWNGRDDDGDEVANGLYFYKLTVRGSGGSKSRIEKIARVR